MWWVMMVSMALLVGAATAIPCQEARMRCAYRTGCGPALQNFVVTCSSVLQGPLPSHCPELCIHSLIALTSTDEGKDLMNCECGDEYCEDQKRRSLFCGPEVNRTISEPIVSCRVAQRICAADALCSTALGYYNQNCRAMFHGKKCTPRCHNSISILRRQKQAAKLTMCKCDGLEDYDCPAIQRNMEKLCFHKHGYHHHNTTNKHKTPTTITTTSTTTRRPSRLPPKEYDFEENMDDKNYGGGSGAAASVNQLKNTLFFLFGIMIITLIT